MNRSSGDRSVALFSTPTMAHVYTLCLESCSSIQHVTTIHHPRLPSVRNKKHKRIPGCTVIGTQAWLCTRSAVLPQGFEHINSPRQFRYTRKCFTCISIRTPHPIMTCSVDPHSLFSRLTPRMVLRPYGKPPTSTTNTPSRMAPNTSSTFFPIRHPGQNPN